jgi:phosphoglucomutase
VEDRANELLRGNNAGVKRVPFEARHRAPATHQEDFVLPYVRDLRNVIDMDAIRGARLKLAVDPLGGSALNPTGNRSMRNINWTSRSS